VPSARSPAGRLRLLHFSQLAPHKGAHVVLDAMKRLAAADRSGGRGGVALDAWGAFATPEYEARLRALADGLDVTFRGAYAHNDPCATPADVAVVPTLAHETWSFWLDEAVTTGLPILASDAGAIGERATGRVKLVPPGDVGALADAIALLRDQPAERLALAAAPAPFIPTLAEHIARLEKLLEEVIHRGAPPLARPTTRPSAEWMHEWQRREIAFGELLRSEGWEDALRWQKSEIERLQKELAARTAAPEKA